MATMGVDDETVVGPRHQDAIVIVDPFVQSKPTRPTQDRRQILRASVVRPFIRLPT